jgi:uncharacterized protein YyaL (SSP411 family)
MDIAIRDFSRDGAPGFYDTPAGDTELAVRPQSLQDNATASGNAVAADVMLTLGVLMERRDLIDRAGTLVASMTELMTTHPTAFGRYLAVAERLVSPPYTLVIGGDPASAGHGRLTTAALGYPQPALVVAHATPGLDREALAAFPVLEGRGERDGASAAWLCREGACMLPATSVADLDARFSEMEAELSVSNT